MAQTDELLAANAKLAAAGEPRALPAAPGRRLTVLTCMDARIDVHAALGLGPGEVHVVRNAGGIVTEDVIRSLAISQRRLGTTEVMVVHHTRCGMQGLDEDELSAELARAAQEPPSFALGAFSDLEADVRESVGRLRTCPYLPHRDQIRGFVFDVDTRRLHEVEPADAHSTAA